jgi:putative ABC transport system permease protein
MIGDYVRLAFVSLKNRGLRSWLTIVGIFIGIAAVISLISLGEGLRLAVLGQFSFLTTDILTVQASGLNFGPPGTGVVNPLQESYIDDLERLRGVDMAIGRMIENSKIQFNGRSDFTFVASMPDREKRKEIERIGQFEIAQGRLLKDGDRNTVVLGYNYGTHERLGKAVKIRDDVIVQGKKYEVVGLLKKKGSFIIDFSILMNEDEVKELFGINDTLSVIAVKVNEKSNMDLVKKRVEDYLRDERDVDEGEEDFSVESAEQSIANLGSTLFAIQMFIYVIAGISIIVGGIGIANTMYTSVVERTKQIGIMKAVGARRKTIFLLFFIEAGLLGAVGGILGVFIGIGIAFGLSALGSAVLGTDLLQVSVSWTLILGAFVFSFVVGCISGILPALQASRLHPVDAMRSIK